MENIRKRGNVVPEFPAAGRRPQTQAGAGSHDGMRGLTQGPSRKLRFLDDRWLVYAQIAQLVEQRTENPRVTGSIPVLGIRNKRKKNREH